MEICNDTNCPCYGRPFTRPRICPHCDHVFQGNGWDGIDAHYRAKHERETGEPYDSWWNRICRLHKSL